MAVRFQEILFDPSLIAAERDEKFPLQASPTFANTHAFNQTTGVVKTNISNPNEIRKLTFNIALADVTASDYFQNFWLGGFGSGYGCRFRYRRDFKVLLEAFGLGNGVTTAFPLYKTYSRPGATTVANVRRIVKPVVNSNLKDLGSPGGSVNLFEPNGVDARVIPSTDAVALGVPAFTIYFGNTPQASGWTVNNTTGIVYFTVAPPNGTVLKWSGEFDLPIAFVGNDYSDNFDIPSTLNNIQAREILPAELEIFD